MFEWVTNAVEWKCKPPQVPILLLLHGMMTEWTCKSEGPEGAALLRIFWEIIYYENYYKIHVNKIHVKYTLKNVKIHVKYTLLCKQKQMYCCIRIHIKFHLPSNLVPKNKCFYWIKRRETSYVSTNPCMGKKLNNTILKFNAFSVDNVLLAIFSSDIPRWPNPNKHTQNDTARICERQRMETNHLSALLWSFGCARLFTILGNVSMRMKTAVTSSQTPLLHPPNSNLNPANLIGYMRQQALWLDIYTVIWTKVA